MLYFDMLNVGVLILAENSEKFQVLWQNKNFETLFDTKIPDWQTAPDCRLLCNEDPANMSAKVVSIESILALPFESQNICIQNALKEDFVRLTKQQTFF